MRERDPELRAGETQGELAAVAHGGARRASAEGRRDLQAVPLRRDDGELRRHEERVGEQQQHGQADGDGDVHRGPLLGGIRPEAQQRYHRRDVPLDLVDADLDPVGHRQVVDVARFDDLVDHDGVAGLGHPPEPAQHEAADGGVVRSERQPDAGRRLDLVEPEPGRERYACPPVPRAARVPARRPRRRCRPPPPPRCPPGTAPRRTRRTRRRRPPAGAGSARSCSSTAGSGNDPGTTTAAEHASCTATFAQRSRGTSSRSASPTTPTTSSTSWATTGNRECGLVRSRSTTAASVEVAGTVSTSTRGVIACSAMSARIRQPALEQEGQLLVERACPCGTRR